MKKSKKRLAVEKTPEIKNLEVKISTESDEALKRIVATVIILTAEGKLRWEIKDYYTIRVSLKECDMVLYCDPEMSQWLFMEMVFANGWRYRVNNHSQNPLVPITDELHKAAISQITFR